MRTKNIDSKTLGAINFIKTSLDNGRTNFENVAGKVRVVRRLGNKYDVHIVNTQGFEMHCEGMPTNEAINLMVAFGIGQ